MDGLLALDKILNRCFELKKLSSALVKEPSNPSLSGFLVDLHCTPAWGVVPGCSELTPVDADHGMKPPEIKSLRFKLGFSHRRARFLTQESKVMDLAENWVL